MWNKKEGERMRNFVIRYETREAYNAESEEEAIEMFRKDGHKYDQIIEVEWTMNKTKISMKDSKVFINSIIKIGKIVAEGELTFDDKGIKLTAMDPANVAMILFEMDKSNFTEYVNDGNNKYGVKFNDFITMLKRIKGDMTLEFGEQIILSCKGKKFTMPILSMDEEQKKVPVLDFKVNISVKADDFKSALEDCAFCALADDTGSITFNVKKTGEFILSTNGKMIDANTDIKLLSHTIPEDMQTKFSIEYLQKFINKTLSDTLTLEFSKDYPLRLTDDKIKYILAPRISESN